LSSFQTPWFDRENSKREMEQIRTWMWHKRFKPVERGRRHGGLLLGDLINRLEHAQQGEKQERLVVYVVPLETITNLMMALSLRSPSPPARLEEIVIELRERSQEEMEKARKTEDGWANVLTGSEGLWMVRVLRNNSPVHMQGCPRGYCSLPTFRQAVAERTLNPEGSEKEIKQACLASTIKPVPKEVATGQHVFG